MEGEGGSHSHISIIFQKLNFNYSSLFNFYILFSVISLLI